MRTVFRSIPCLAVLLIAAGCSDGEKGPPKVSVSGKVSDKGSPLVMAPGGPPGASKVEVSFHPIGADGKASTTAGPVFAIVQDNGSFTVDGGVPTGKYKVVIHQWNPFPDKDVLKGKFSKEKSPVVKEFTSDTSNLELDVSTLK